MDWNEARNWCKEKKMRLAELKNITLFNGDEESKERIVGKKN